MKEERALAALPALPQETRLPIEAGPEGMVAGAIGEAIGATTSRLSFHLKDLELSGAVLACACEPTKVA